MRCIFETVEGKYLTVDMNWLSSSIYTLRNIKAENLNKSANTFLSFLLNLSPFVSCRNINYRSYITRVFYSFINIAVKFSLVENGAVRIAFVRELKASQVTRNVKNSQPLLGYSS